MKEEVKIEMRHALYIPEEYVNKIEEEIERKEEENKMKDEEKTTTTTTEKKNKYEGLGKETLEKMKEDIIKNIEEINTTYPNELKGQQKEDPRGYVERIINGEDMKAVREKNYYEQILKAQREHKEYLERNNGRKQFERKPSREEESTTTKKKGTIAVLKPVFDTKANIFVLGYQETLNMHENVFQVGKYIEDETGRVPCAPPPKPILPEGQQQQQQQEEQQKKEDEQWTRGIDNINETDMFRSNKNSMEAVQNEIGYPLMANHLNVNKHIPHDVIRFISRKHFTIFYYPKNDRYILINHSKNGTLVDEFLVTVQPFELLNKAAAEQAPEDRRYNEIRIGEMYVGRNPIVYTINTIVFRFRPTL